MFYGWYIAVASSLIMGYNSFLYIYGFTSFINPIINTFGWSYTQVSLAVSVRTIATGIMNPLLGSFVDRWPARRLLIIGSLAMGLGLFSLSKMTNLAMFYAGFLLMGLGGSLAVQLVPLTTVARWFSKNLGKANGIMGFGIALGGVGVPLLVMAIDYYGWQNTYLYGAVGTLLLMIPLSFIFRNRPEQYGLAPDGKPSEAIKDATSQTNESTGFGVKKALKTRTFWLIGIGYMVQVGGSLALLTHIMPHFTDIGMERAYASLIVMSIALVGLAARIPIGWLMDVTSRRNVIAISIGLSSISFLLFWFIRADSLFAFVIAFAIPFGIGNASIHVRSAIVRQYFGVKSFGAIFGVMMIFPILGTSIFPASTGMIFDKMGTYGPAFLALSASNLATAFLTLAIPRVPEDYDLVS